MTQHNRTYYIAGTVVLLILLWMTPTWAQTVDLRPQASSALEWVATTLGAVLTLLAGFGVRFVSTKIGLANSELEASLNARLNDIIHRGIDAAYMRGLQEVNDPKSGLEAIKVDNIFVGWVIEYVTKAAPGIIARFNLQARIKDMILARLPGYVPQLTNAVPAPSPVA